ncbi:MAG: 4Fe-4S dicluster domain-containing protein [Lachnospiraceae bacterium]|nr:4Fe-4S dicluster domain-containing protein [Lachnospiraceae bacterium]
MDKELLSRFPKSKHIEVDTEACAGCLTCELACAARHFDGLCDRELSAIKIDADMLEYHFDYMVCRQCKAPSCVLACPKDAFYFDEKTGARVIDKSKCIKCGACVRACPFAGQKNKALRKVEKNGEKYIVKCDLCHGHEDGPYCVQVCPKAAVKLKA